jgi:hypothetical protein
MCGGDLNIIEGASTAECEFCGSVQTVPKVDDEKKLTLFARANRLRAACEFDKAAGIYEAIVADFQEEAEAYWGLVLCKYGIEYVDDPATGKKIPTCHRSSFDSIMDDSDLEQALENADPAARKVYREEAKAIEEIRKGIIAVSANEEPYDIFICYKETAEDGDRTLDSVLAQDVYDALTDKGYRVFFSRITLEDKLGQEYEPYIFAALNSAKIMLAFGTDYEYFNAVWVKNEWSRYLKLMAKDKDKHLIPCYKGIDAYDMPKEFAKLQAQDLGKVGATQDLLRGIAKILSPQVSPVAVAQKPATSTSAMVMRGQFALDDGDWAKADEYFERALDENPEDAKAYVGKVLVGLRLSAVEQINDRLVKLEGDRNFERAIRFSVGADKAQLESVKELADKKWLVKKFTVGLKKIATKKEADEIFDSIKRYAATATVEGYEKIVSLCTSVRMQGTNTAITQTVLDSYRRQLDIMRLLSSDLKEYTVADIKASKYFSGTYWATSLFLEYLNKMIADGSIERGSTSDTYCVAGSTEKRIQKQKENDYARATSMMVAAGTYSKFFEAADLFANLGDYLDSVEKAEECRATGEQFKAEMEAIEARHREEQRVERERQEAERKAAEEKRRAEIQAHNDTVNAKIAEAEQALKEQNAIYAANAGKIFGSGAKLKKAAKAEIARLESAIANLKRTLR